MRIICLSLFLIAAACSGGGDGSPTPPSNRAPAFTSASSVSVPENSIGVVYTATAADPDGDALTFSVAGGADAGAFSITGAGALSFISPRDFEAPSDADADNIFDVTLSVSDGALSTTLALRVTVVNVAEAFRVRRVVSGLSQPLFFLDRGDGKAFILEKGGQIELLDLATGILNPTPFLDLAGSISINGERGLLGMALAPDYTTSGVFYVNVTNVAGHTEIRRYQRSAGNADAADPASVDVILFATQPASNHNGGWLDFGPDGFLYIALGDGGGSDDQFGNGQNVNTVLGAMLRIDPSTDAFPADASRDYAIPAGNPFAAGGGAPEIFAYGLRNPFRCAFDRTTGALYIGDVGQGAREEIDLIPAGVGGLNFGWPVLEGTRVNQPGSTAGMTPPVLEYEHVAGDRGGRSVTGGLVHRGAVDDLRGQYLFADFIQDNVWSAAAASLSQGATVSAAQFTVQNAAFAPDIGILDNVAAFGESSDGQLWIVDLDGEVFVVEKL